MGCVRHVRIGHRSALTIGVIRRSSRLSSANSPDPKHFNYLLGCATTIDEMGLKWANGQTDYATRLKGFMQNIKKP